MTVARERTDGKIDLAVGPGHAGSVPRSVEAWFLGPKAENAEEFERLVLEAVRDHVFWRRNFHPGDPSHITEAIKRSPEYLDALGSLEQEFRTLLAQLKKSVPFFSMRYQGHMNWDLTMPSVLGYFAAMLYNPNNVAFEASTATTLFEIVVGDELCRMIGYEIPDEATIQRGGIRPWGHITCDGTVANIESMWMARNLKLFPVALKAAIAAEEGLRDARGVEVEGGDGGIVRLADADLWTVLNLKVDSVLALPARLASDFGVERDTLTASLGRHSLQSLGFQEFARRNLAELERAPAMFVPGTKHYSWPKAAAVLGLGAQNLVNVPLDLDARMDVAALRGLLEECLSQRRPVISVVGVVGSTEESAIDPIEDILALRDELRGRGLEFVVHADAAWGGYPTSMIRPDAGASGADGDVHVPPSLSHYAQRHLGALGRTDSITLDPHKSGYIPYPAGALCYRNSAMRDLVTFSAPVVFHGDAEPTVGIYGLEGSKPGAAVASVYLSHRVVAPSQSGYGQIIGQTLLACELLYVRLVTMFGPRDPFVVVPVARLPAEVAGGDVEEQMAFLRERIDRRNVQELLEDEQVLDLLRDLGPDLNILAYAFNFRDSDGTVNTDLTLANKLNRAIYDRLSINPGEDIYGYDLIVSTTELDAADYGKSFIENYKRRLLGTSDAPGARVTILRSVIMDPWITETAEGSFLDVLETEYRKAVTAAHSEIRPISVRGY